MENRIRTCPECCGDLLHDRNPYVTPAGVIQRVRICKKCKRKVHTKQGPEEICPTFMQGGSQEAYT